MMNFKRFYFKSNLLVFLLLCSTITYGQQSLNIVDLYYSYLLNKPARSIQAEAKVGAYAFHEGIGGIAFESVATPSKAIGNSKISLDYESDRFSVTINGQKIYPELPDWQLIPTAIFADSPYQVLFSPLGDTDRNGEAQCRYHPAFLNTLAGLRIFEADLLNLPNLLWDLPKNPEGEYILAESEKSFTPQMDELIEQKLYNDLCGDVKPFSSFILTDKNANISFDINDNQIQFTGHPYYLFTKNESDLEHIDNLKKELEQTYTDVETNSKIFLGSKYTSNLNPRKNLGGLLKVLKDNRNEETFNPYAMHAVVTAIGKLDSLNSLNDAEIGIKLSILNQYSTTFNENWDILKKYNPPVYSTVENIAQWAAFFRYVKKTNPASWNSFLGKISKQTVKDAPKVNTPTSYDINYFRLMDESENRDD
ncbi:MAG: hypothetical protein LBC48_01635 [Dysgonamonadaceae bacterium]|jgi:hypothetical protein|nr:hypothetical protein [Dysgonamonadaceae bacterium]